MKATLTTISSSPVKEKSFLIVDHFFLFVNQTWMWKGGPPAHPCWITTFKRCKHIHHSSTVACHHTSLTPAFQHWFSPYLLFPSVSGCTGAKCEGITGGKRRHRDLDLGQGIRMPGIFQAQSYQSSVTEMMSAQCCCLGRDATCPSAQKRLWGSRNETSSALGQAPALLLPPSSYSPSATLPDSKAMEIDTWWPKHVHTLPRWPQMAREMAALWQTVPGGGDGGEASQQTHQHQRGLWFGHCTGHPRTGLATVSAEVRLGREVRRHLGVTQSSRWLFRRKPKKQDGREVPGCRRQVLCLKQEQVCQAQGPLLPLWYTSPQ